MPEFFALTRFNVFRFSSLQNWYINTNKDKSEMCDFTLCFVDGRSITVYLERVEAMSAVKRLHARCGTKNDLDEVKTGE